MSTLFATTATLHSALTIADGQAPEWVHLIPAGTFSGVDGRGPYTLQNAAAVIAASALPAPIDEMHATDLGGSSLGMAAPARGWIVELQARDDGIWGRVDWTAAGRVLVTDRAYRGLSPVMDVAKKGGAVTRLRRASLTNVPNLPLTTLHSQGASMDFMTRLRAALGLPEAADESAIVTALESVIGDRTMQSQALAGIAPLLGVPKEAKPPEFVTALQARLKSTGDAATLQSQVTDLQGQLTALHQTTAKERATAAIDAAIRAGKPVLAMRDHYITRHAADPAGVQRELDALPSLNAGGITPGILAKPAADGLTAEDEAVLALMNISRADFLKQREAEGQRTTMGV